MPRRGGTGDGRAKRGANDRSDYVHERAFHVFEKDKSADKQKRDNDGTDGHHDKVRALLTKQCPAKPLDDSSHRVQAVEEPPIFGHKADWVRDRGSKHPALSKEWDGEAHIPVPDVKGRAPEPHGEGRSQGQEQKER